MKALIKRVETKKELGQFIKFPWQIYKEDNFWVPPLISDFKYVLSDKNPFWHHAEKGMFLAEKNSNIVGRIIATIDHNYVKFQNEKVGFFGFFESINDAEVANDLMTAVGEWLKSKGMKKMQGPMNPSTNDECGFLIEGFGMRPCLMMPYNPSYYIDLMNSCGMEKAKDLYAYLMEVDKAPRKRLERLSEQVLKREENLTIRQFNLKNFDEEVKNALEVYNNAWEKNWGFVPWTEEEFYDIASRLKSLFFPETTLIAEVEGKPIGLLIAVPDYNEILKKINGRLSPLGLLKFIVYRNRIEGLRLMILGVVKDYRQRGIEGLLYYYSWKAALEKKFRTCEFSWVLEDNILTQRASSMMGGKLYKKYRIYKKQL